MINSSLFKTKSAKSQKIKVDQKDVESKEEKIYPQDPVASTNPPAKAVQQGDRVKLEMYDPALGEEWIASYNQLTSKGFLGKLTPKERVIISPPKHLAFLALEGKVMVSTVVWRGIHQLVEMGCGHVYLQLGGDQQYYQVNTESKPFGLIPVESSKIGYHTALAAEQPLPPPPPSPSSRA